MKTMTMRHLLLPALLLGAGLLQGCASGPKTLYQWEGYQPQVYEYLKGEGSVEQQIAELEKGLQVIRARGNTPPPGYHAHLGMLYAQLGKDDQVVQQFRTEEALFPEAKPYMDFLLKKPATSAN
jgi:hypothetical protein